MKKLSIILISCFMLFLNSNSFSIDHNIKETINEMEVIKKQREKIMLEIKAKEIELLELELKELDIRQIQVETESKQQKERINLIKAKSDERINLMKAKMNERIAYKKEILEKQILSENAEK